MKRHPYNPCPGCTRRGLDETESKFGIKAFESQPHACLTCVFLLLFAQLLSDDSGTSSVVPSFVDVLEVILTIAL